MIKARWWHTPQKQAGLCKYCNEQWGWLAAGEPDLQSTGGFEWNTKFWEPRYMAANRSISSFTQSNNFRMDDLELRAEAVLKNHGPLPSFQIWVSFQIPNYRRGQAPETKRPAVPQAVGSSMVSQVLPQRAPCPMGCRIWLISTPQSWLFNIQEFSKLIAKAIKKLNYMDSTI